MKVVIIGGVAAGATAATRLRRLDERAEIVMLDKGPHVSFSNCSLPFRLSGTVEDTGKLVMMTPQAFAARYRIGARVNSEAVAIDRDSRTVRVRNLTDGTEYDESYDKLILSPGAQAIVPPIPGIDQADVFTLKTVTDVDRLHTFLTERGVTRVSVVGGGFIGVEAAVNLVEAGYQVSLVEAAPQILNTFDQDMVQILHKALLDHGVNLIVGDQVTRCEGNDLTLASGRVIEGQAVVMAVGIRPDTALAADAGLDVNGRGAILTDASYRTNDPDIYAIGDAIEVTNALTHRPMMLQLAGPAQKQARQVADHICGRAVRNTGYIGSNCIKVFEWNAAGTGLTAAQCEREGLRYDYAYVIPQDKVSLMPDSRPLHVKLIFEVPTGRVLGAQAIGQGMPPNASTWWPRPSSSAPSWTICATWNCATRRRSPTPRTRSTWPRSWPATCWAATTGRPMWTRRAHSWNPGRRSSTCANPVPSPRAISRALSISRSRRCARGWTRSPPTGRCT